MATDAGGAIETPVAHLKRALRVWDLTFLCVVAVLNLNLVPVIAANGPVTVWLWVAALLLFFLPQGIAVIELSHHFPQEGGIYVWTKEMFGDLHGFLCGWCYWTNNMFYIPTLLFYLVGIVTYMGGRYVHALSASPLFFFCLTVGLLWVMALANIRGLGVGKWVNNAGRFHGLAIRGLGSCKQLRNPAIRLEDRFFVRRYLFRPCWIGAGFCHGR
jgi:amino acid transporter